MNENPLVKLRRSKVVSLLRAQNLDALLLSRIENVRYVSGFRPVISPWFRESYWAVLSADGSVALIVTGGDFGRVKEGMRWIDQVKMLKPSKKTEMLSETVREITGESVRVGYDSLEFEDMRSLSNLLPRTVFSPLGGALAKVRSVKLPEELAVIRRGAKITEDAVRLAAEKAKAGIRECELAGMAEGEARSAGAEGVSWSFATFSGSHAALMFRYDTTKRLRNGEFLIMGYATTYEGYNTDITATTVVGESPSTWQKKTFAVVLDAYQAALSLARPGGQTREMSLAAARTIEEAGIDSRYSFATYQSLLHGLGMNVYEPPFSPDPGLDEPNYTLEQGNVLAVEPTVAYFDKPSLGGIRVGETIVIGNNGPRVLGRFPEKTLSIFAVK